MNKLSLLIYIADVSGRALCIFLILGVISIIVGAFAAVFKAIAAGDQAEIQAKPERSHYPAESWTPYIELFGSLKKLLTLGVILVLLGIFIPSRNTVYAIAASEVGEKIVQSEAVQGIATDASKALQNWIKRQIDPPAKAEK